MPPNAYAIKVNELRFSAPWASILAAYTISASVKASHIVIHICVMNTQKVKKYLPKFTANTISIKSEKTLIRQAVIR